METEAEKKARWARLFAKLREVELDFENQKWESARQIKAAKETPTITAQAAADYYHDLTAAQDMLEKDGR